MINPLTYCRILGMSIEMISQQKTFHGVTQTLTGRQVVVRFRAIHAEVSFFYKARPIKQLSAWTGIDAAISDAKRHAREWQLTADDQVEIAVAVVMTEESAALIDSSSHFLSYWRENDDLKRAISVLPGHVTSAERFDGVWSTKDNEALNVRRVAELESALEKGARPAHQCVAEARRLFDANRELCA